MAVTGYTKAGADAAFASINRTISGHALTADVTLTKSDVGLSAVDNTADSGKTVASAAALTTPRTIDGTSFNGTANITVVAPAIHAASAKTTPADADEFDLVDSAASFVLKKWTWANLKVAMATYYNSLTATVTGKDLSSGNTFPTFNQNTTGSAATLTTARTINGVSFNGSANIAPRLDQIATPTASVAMGTQKITGLATPTATTDASTKAYVDAGDAALDSLKLDITAVESTVLSVLPGAVQMVYYSSGWPSNSDYSDATHSWWFVGGDVAHAPPSVTGNAVWDRPS